MFQTNTHSPCSTDQNTSDLPKDYVRTTNQQKLQLIDLIINEKYAMQLASEIVGVKLSTVKYIIKAYKTDKESFMSKIKPKNNRFSKLKQIKQSRSSTQTASDPIPNNQEHTKPNICGAEILNSKMEIKKSEGQALEASIESFNLFQSYCQLISQWNNFSTYNNGWASTYQLN